ncbi:hypothetical protein DRW03_06685 [Corallococcus sp. H22C18031201]|uniref:hypothetical protein n=1 Tax=Citreicoccus inhibens TaxID=2849499 RepID=UPI000E72330D|nr:hypothetical protein [Citreicoccus inhibens]MBU8900444.1 hypothetical protein [Citreicoccus inhibens]RJS26136.1 hypothetical protein DRW03_06685 [Corallococcus sp. H22C18031201]
MSSATSTATEPMGRFAGSSKMGLAFGVGAVCLIAALAGFFVGDASAAAHSYLIAFAYWVGISVASTIMLAIFHTAKAKWPIVLRRTMETMGATVPVFIVLFVGVVLGLKQLYSWWPESPLAAHIEGIEKVHLGHKQHGYLFPTFFWVRQAIYFTVWTLVSWRLRSWSMKQDETGELELTVKQRKFAPGALPFLALTITFAAFDWLMSLTPLWQSTIYGAYYFAGSFLAAFCLLTVVTVLAQGKDLYGSVVTTAHYHNLGKLMFAFTAFWAYIGFSQFLLVWIANLPEEAPWYGIRIFGAWRPLSIALVLLHFVLPFFTLLSRNLKLQPRKLMVVALYLLLMHWLDLYWLVWPAMTGKAGPSFHWTLPVAFVGVGGIAVGFALMLARNKFTLPVKDPYITESMRYVQP